MNTLEKLLALDAGTLENPKGIHKMYCKKLKAKLDFEIEAIDPERAFEIRQDAIKVEGNSKKVKTDIDTFFLKTRIIMAGCKLFSNKELMAKFSSPTPVELIKKMLTEGEINSLSDAITELGDADEVDLKDEIKN